MAMNKAKILMFYLISKYIMRILALFMAIGVINA
jgi:hypothetical protein